MVSEVVELTSQTEVTYPTSHITVEVSQATLHRNPTTATREFLDTLLEGFQFLRRDFDRHALPNKSEPQVLAA